MKASPRRWSSGPQKSTGTREEPACASMSATWACRMLRGSMSSSPSRSVESIITPCSSRSPETTWTSEISGTPRRRHGSSASSAATSALETRFLAPRTSMSPTRGIPPLTRRLDDMSATMPRQRGSFPADHRWKTPASYAVLRPGGRPGHVVSGLLGHALGRSLRRGGLRGRSLGGGGLGRSLLRCGLGRRRLGRGGLRGRSLGGGGLGRSLLRRDLGRRSLGRSDLLRWSCLGGGRGDLGDGACGRPATGQSGLRELARVGDDVLERGAGLEAGHRGLLDAHLVTRARVAAGTRGARGLLEGAEAGDADLAALGDLTNDRVEDGLKGVGGGLAATELGLQGLDQFTLVHFVSPMMMSGRVSPTLPAERHARRGATVCRRARRVQHLRSTPFAAQRDQPASAYLCV